jgi:hypothetical protein
MRINIVSVGPAEAKRSAKGTSYNQIEVFYKNDKGEAKSKKVFSFSREIYPTIAKASPGEQYEVTVEKKGDFWEWIAINRATDAAPAAAGAAAATAPTRPNRNSEEVDRRIARSVALKAAVDYFAQCAGGKADKSPEAVLGLSMTFEDYLFGGREALAEKVVEVPTTQPPTEELTDDIPF